MLKLNKIKKTNNLIYANSFNKFRNTYICHVKRNNYYLFNQSLLSKMHYPRYLYLLRKKKKKYIYISLSSHVTRFNKLDGYDLFTIIFFQIKFKKFYEKKFLLYNFQRTNLFILNFLSLY